MKTLKMIFRTMKKYTFIFAALTVMAAGCAKEAQIAEKEAETPEETSSVVFTAGIDTKAQLDGTALMWKADDEITIWNGTSAVAFTTSDNGPTATFMTTEDFPSAASYVALYPADGEAGFTASSVTTTLPAAQTATAGTFDPAAGLATAKTDNTTLSFSNLVSYLKFTVPAGMDDLTSVSFKGNAGEKVAGAVSVNVEAKELTATGSETATLSGTFAAEKTYYLALAPQAFNAGYTVTITRTSGTYDMVSGKNVTFSRSKSRNIGELWDGNNVFVVEGTGIEVATEMTHITGTTQHDEVHSFRGALKAGTIQIRSKYKGIIIRSGITIPTAGNYHIMYNATSGSFKLYSQDVLVDFVNGGDTGVGVSTAPWNMFTAADSNLDVADYFGNNTGINIKVAASATHNGTGGGDKNGPSIFIDDDEWPRSVWYDSFEFDNGSATADSDPFIITISHLDSSASYDIRLISMRFNATQTARLTQFTVIGQDTSAPQTVYQGYARGSWVGYDAYDFRTNNTRDFENITPDTEGKIVIQVVGKLVGTRASYHVNGFRISKLL